MSSGSGKEEVGGASRRLEVEEPVSGVYQCHISSQYGMAISTTVLCAQSES